MHFDFDTIVSREGKANLKDITNPEHIRKAGIENFAAAEMDYKTAPSVINAIVDCARGGLLGFTLADDRYRAAVRWWLESMRDSKIEESWVVPTHGTIFSVATAIRLTTSPGEGIIVQPPTYYRYEQAATRLGRKTVYNTLIYKDGSYFIDFNDLEQKMAMPENKLMILCNPQNPIGRVWQKSELERIAAIARVHDVLVFSDEIFAETTFGGARAAPYYEVEDAFDNCIVSTSLGKAFNFTGVNHANMVIPSELLRERFTAQRNADHYGSVDPLVYAAVLGAYSQEGKQWVQEMCAYTEENIKNAKSFFEREYRSVKVSPVQGGFSLWLNWNELFKNEDRLMEFLNNRALLNVERGSTYGAPCFTRMNMTTSKAQLERVLNNLKEAKSYLK